MPDLTIGQSLFSNCMKHFLLPLFIFITSLSFAQSVITGTVIDGEFNDPLPFANLILRNQSDQTNLGGITTDFDGKYFFEVVDGIYTIELSYVGLPIHTLFLSKNKKFLKSKPSMLNHS